MVKQSIDFLAYFLAVAYNEDISILFYSCDFPEHVMLADQAHSFLVIFSLSKLIRWSPDGLSLIHI